MNLQQKTKYVNIVIRVKNYIPNVDKIKEWCVTNCELYSLILHDKDIQADGTLIPSHCHMVLTMLKSQRLSTTLNSLTGFLGIINTGVEIDKTTSFEGSIQYLLHKNEVKKYQYKFEDIVSNIPSDELKTILECKASTFSFDKIYDVCLKADSLIEVIKMIGIQNYNMYYKVIKDVYYEVQRVKMNPYGSR